jgi:hypothetical protein
MLGYKEYNILIFPVFKVATIQKIWLRMKIEIFYRLQPAVK